ncbi:hNH endonuclease [Citrobacter sp. MGH 55]|uniref:hNH endonuclease n=1 Tax=Citrobacter sp. MGH 55 TaxID=1439319 RepID=UPI00049EFB2E|nr:hNH endonuclease [Citrobacter sp. MGH 55]KDF07801.1 hypothetical protein AF41_02483 [Citrobacter sp. MGH 55]
MSDFNIEELLEQLENAQREFRSADITMQNLEAKCEKLAAENAGLKEALEYVINPDNAPEYHSLGMGCGVEDRGYQRDGYSACEYGWESAMERVYSEVIPDAIPETPATEAFLAEVRAQGVEMFATELGNVYQQLRSGSNHAHAIKSAVFRAVEFAALLRKGVQS